MAILPYDVFKSLGLTTKVGAGKIVAWPLCPNCRVTTGPSENKYAAECARCGWTYSMNAMAQDRAAMSIQESIRYEPAEGAVEIAVTHVPYTCGACRNTKLDETDKNCWRCGSTKLERS